MLEDDNRLTDSERCLLRVSPDLLQYVVQLAIAEFRLFELLIGHAKYQLS